MWRPASPCGWMTATTPTPSPSSPTPAIPNGPGRLSLHDQAGLIAGATGLSGRNIDYLRDLVEHLRGEGLRDQGMERLLALVEAREEAALAPIRRAED